MSNKLVRPHLNKKAGHGGACNPNYAEGNSSRTMAHADLGKNNNQKKNETPSGN
jgi:hypothetical protein